MFELLYMVPRNERPGCYFILVLYLVIFILIFLQRKKLESKHTAMLFFQSAVSTVLLALVFNIPSAAKISGTAGMILMIVYLIFVIKKNHAE